MTMLTDFFLTDPVPSLTVVGSYNPWLVTLSLLIAVFTSSIALHLVGAVRNTDNPVLKRVGILSSGLALGGGIWSMHFIGMMAFEMNVPVEYDPGLTLLSAVPGVLACWLAMARANDERLDWRRLAINGLLLGAGIGTMHYTGMAAMKMSSMMHYDPYLFALSIVVAVLLAMLALSIKSWIWLGFRHLSRYWVSLISGSVMGLAISAMHYTGMAAVVFVSDSPLPMSGGRDDTAVLALSVSLFTCLITVIALSINALLWYRNLVAQISANASRMDAILNTAVDGIITIDHKGIIQSFNPAAERILGWSADEVSGMNVSMLMPEPDHSAHDGYLEQYRATRKPKIIGSGREVMAKHKMGHLVPIRLGVGEVNLPGSRALYVGFITDISQRRAMEAELREREERYRSLISNIPGASYRCRQDSQWSMAFISDAIRDLTGWSPEMLEKGEMTLGEMIHPDDREMVEGAVARHAENQQRFMIEYRIRHRDGRWIWLLDHGSFSYDEQGQVKWIDGVLLDISSRKAIEAALVEAKEQAEGAASVKSEFLANMS
ncbi:MAG: PAS domain S-box protein, partial [Oceanospirillales bacterium]|nr:PAS domain S-box protein [Oceanospirillales bacterium]